MKLRGNINDQAEAYEADGLTHLKAVSEAIRQMGDPIEAGVALDRIHRPKTEWSMILIILALTVFGIIIQSILFKYSGNAGVNLGHLSKTIFYNLLGVGVMAVVYSIDYSILGKHPVASLFVYLFGCLVIIIYLVYSRPRPAVYYSIITLFIPFFAAIVYHFRNKGWKGFLGCITLFLLYFFIAYRFLYGITALIETTICALIIVTAVILKGGFGVLLSVTVIGVLFLLFIKSFHISMQQRNLLGYLVGLGCSTLFLTKTVLYLASNFGYGLFASPTMPFLSFGLCSTLTNFAMMGLLLSIYRNTELISEETCQTKYKAKIFHKKTHII